MRLKEYDDLTQGHLNDILEGFVSQSEKNIDWKLYEVTPIRNDWFQVKCGNVVFQCGKGFLKMIDEEFKKQAKERYDIDLK
jgi:hypothetical protein